ncbi:CpsD/CapB family tyrosine-protein kinase [Pseudogemmobacter sonorensis]|uniref:CpsD/CapB family tyrosine-protein kinase n=1 Tax=Pseudogemmobacter sonorensis TaxID=2989681 RepID=UPI0036AAFC01
MSGEDQDSRSPGQSRRGNHVSVFRRGQVLPPETVMLDQRTGREIFLNDASFATPNPARIWESLNEIAPDPYRLTRNGLFTNAEQHPAAKSFDILRSRVLQGMAKQGWTRLAVTSPGPGCGKSFVAANLALSMGRLPSCRTVLLDLDLRAPGLAHLFDQRDAAPLLEFLMGEQPLESQFRRLGRNLVLGLNGAPVPLAAEALHDPAFAEAMTALREMLEPDVVICDVAPTLTSDEVIALSGQMDAVLLVTDGTRTSPEEITECERLFEGRLPLLGVVLNRAQDRKPARHGAARLFPGRRG